MHSDSKVKTAAMLYTQQSTETRCLFCNLSLILKSNITIIQLYSSSLEREAIKSHRNSKKRDFFLLVCKYESNINH